MWWMMGAQLLWAQEVQLSIDSDQVVVGVPTTLTILATGFEEDPTPEVGEITVQGKGRDNVRLDFIGVDPMVSRQTSIVNGRRSDSVFVRYAYRYRLVVDREGTFQIPTIQVTQGDTSATSRPARLQVVEAPTTPEMAIALDMPKNTVWVGQTIPLNIDIFLQRDIGDLNVVVPLFDEFPVSPRSNKTGGQQFSLNTVHGEISLPVEQGTVERDGQGYTRVRLMGQTTLSKPGIVEVQPSRILAQMVVGKQRGMLGFSRNEYQLFQAKDSLRTLDVRPLPLRDQPDSFSGAVGESFSISVRANKTVVAVGEPIPLEVEIKGKGNLDGIQLPSFVDLGLDPSIFESPTQKPLGLENDEGAKVFTFSVRLTESNVREIPTLQFAYFDPNKGTYRRAYTQPIALSVSGSSVVSSAQVVSATEPKNTTLNDGGIQSLSTSQFDLSWQNGNTVPQLPWKLIAFLCHGLAVGLWFWLGWRDRTKDQRREVANKMDSMRSLKDVFSKMESAPAATIANELTITIKNFGEEHNCDVAQIVSQIEIESYHPKAKQRPFSATIRQLIGNLLPMILCVVFWGQPALAESDQFELTYRSALTIEDAMQRQRSFKILQNQMLSRAEINPHDVELWTNIGTVSLQIPDRGQAVYAYNMASLLGSTSPQVSQNIEQLQMQLPNWTQVSTRAVWKDVLFWTDRVPDYVQQLVLSTLILAVAVVWKRRRTLAKILLLLWAVCLFGVSLVWVEDQQLRVVVMDTTPLHSADHTQSPLVKNEWLPSGVVLPVVQRHSEWVQVRLSNNEVGWLELNRVKELSLSSLDTQPSKDR